MFLFEAAVVLGAAALLKVLISFGQGIYVAFFRAGKDLKRYGEWAVVTGATDGIGKAIAREMLAAGLSVIIVARTQSKLDETKAELEASAEKKETDCKVETLCIDFTQFGGPETDPHKRAVIAFEGKDIGVLVNNVGMSYEFPMWFHDLTDADVKNLLTMNVDSVVWMTRIVLKGMVQRKRGAILNISSASGLIPAPLLALYGATKQFVEKFSKELDTEYNNAAYRIQVQSQAPLWIATKLASVRREKASIFTPLPEVYAKGAVRKIGYESSNAGYWVHDIVVCACSVLQSLGFSSVLQSQALAMHKGINKAGLEKRARKEEEAKLEK
jgi:17beta-estradiol 17-dehydrogenase / very-long-chain 3-oxoacyl-CoA reductase